MQHYTSYKQKRHTLFNLFITSILLSVTISCSNNVGKVKTRLIIDPIGENVINVDKSGESFITQIKINSDEDMLLYNNAEWLTMKHTIAEKKDYINLLISITVMENRTPNNRTADIILKKASGQCTIKIHQLGK